MESAFGVDHEVSKAFGGLTRLGSGIGRGLSNAGTTTSRNGMKRTATGRIQSAAGKAIGDKPMQRIGGANRTIGRAQSGVGRGLSRAGNFAMKNPGAVGTGVAAGGAGLATGGAASAFNSNKPKQFGKAASYGQLKSLAAVGKPKKLRPELATAEGRENFARLNMQRNASQRPRDKFLR